LERNLKANANSRNPKNTLTEFSQPPDFGKEFNQPGNAANKPKGRASARENPNIPINGPTPPIVADSTRSVPTMGPVHENETRASVNAIKNIPRKPPFLDAESALLTHVFGRFISKAPKNDKANTISRIKKNKLK
jgi:hypothetical protein